MKQKMKKRYKERVENETKTKRQTWNERYRLKTIEMAKTKQKKTKWQQKSASNSYPKMKEDEKKIEKNTRNTKQYESMRVSANLIRTKQIGITRNEFIWFRTLFILRVSIWFEIQNEKIQHFRSFECMRKYYPLLYVFVFYTRWITLTRNFLLFVFFYFHSFTICLIHSFLLSSLFMVSTKFYFS